jgi:hypothetical protein
VKPAKPVQIDFVDDSPKTSRFDLNFLKIWKILKKQKPEKINDKPEKSTRSFFIQKLNFK